MNKRLWVALVSVFFLTFTLLSYAVEETTEDTTATSIESSEITSSTETTTETTTSETITESTEQTEDVPENLTAKEELNFQKIKFNKYVSLNEEKTIIYLTDTLTETLEHDYVKGQTFLAKEKIIYSDGKEFYSLFNAKDEFVGFVPVLSVTVANDKGGILQPIQKYATIQKNDGKLLTSFEKESTNSTVDLYKQTFRVKGVHIHFDGILYYQIFDNKDKFLGYISDADVSLTDGAQGSYQNLNQYVTIRSNNYSIWQNFGWKKKYDSKQFLNRTFLAKGEYRHFNGDTYYSLYDTNNVWYGYINKSAVNGADSAQGPYFSFGKYVTVKNSNQNAWSSFNWTNKQSLKNISGKTFSARGVYHHANGNDYYSLYDNKGTWQGYVNKSFVSLADGAQGTYQSFGKYVTVTANNYTFWQNFSWKAKGSSSKLYMKTYQARGLYRHYNGSVYYSVYDNKGVWQGYVNANGTTVADGPQGIYQSYWKDVVISKKNYPMWNSFSWIERDNTNNHFNKKFKARGIYRHFNGSTYVSLYDNSGKWYGYLNQAATSEDAEKMAKVQQLINTKYRSSNYGIYVMSLTDGSSATMNSNTIFTAASTGKLPAMYYTQKMINQNKLNPNQPYLYTDRINQMGIYSYGRGGAGILQYRPFGGYYSLDTILHWTAKYSDNQGANFLGYYGANQFEAKMRNEISSIIGRQWISPFNVSAKENALMMQAIYNEGGQLLTYMQDTIYDNDRIPKYLPVKVAHKVGDVGEYRHDVGVVYTDRPYILSVLTKNNTSYEMTARLSKEIYDIMK